MYFLEVPIADFPNKEIITFFEDLNARKSSRNTNINPCYYDASLLYYDNAASFYVDISNLTC